MPVRSRAGWGGNLIGRLKQGVGVQAAQTSLSRLVGQLEAEATWTKAAGVEIAGLHAWNVQTARSTVLMLFSATGFILLLACVNVSGLQVARGAERVRELGIRASLGASRSRLVRQLLTESVLLSICAGVAGAGLAWLTLNLLVSTLPLDPRGNAAGNRRAGAGVRDGGVWRIGVPVRVVAGVPTHAGAKRS